MKKNAPYWYTLTSVFKRAERPYRVTTGLTVPFIFGAYQLIGNSFNDVRNLLDEICNSAIDEYPALDRCTQTGQHVLALEEKPAFLLHRSRLVNLLDGSIKRGLFVPNTGTLGDTIERVCGNLEREYGDQIKKKNFSYERETGWRKFDKTEEQLIRQRRLR